MWVRVHACVCVRCVLARSARAFVRIGVVDGLHAMRAVQWRLTVLYVCVCVYALCAGGGGRVLVYIGGAC